MMGHCEECLALQMLLENNLIDKSATICDRPDIVSNDECVEVTSAINDEIDNRLNFGKLPKESQYTNMSDYNCNTCEFLQTCKTSICYDCMSECMLCKDKHLWLKDSIFIISKGTAYYNNGEHPMAISWSASCEGSEIDLKRRISDKEIKSMHYTGKNLGIFLYYDRFIDNVKPITSDIFNNIYIYCVNLGLLYKNWTLIKHYASSSTIVCYNKLCDDYGKFKSCK